MLPNTWKRHTPLMVGIDIGSHDIKFILLSQTSNGYKVEDFGCVPIQKNTLHNQDSDALSQSLKQLKLLLPKTVKNAVVAVSGSGVINKQIFLNAAFNDEEMASQVEIEAANLIPYPIEEVSIDFEVTGINKIDPSKVDVLLSACRTENIDILVDALEDIKLKARIVDIEGYALGRSAELIYEQLPGSHTKLICLIDIGSRKTTFSIVRNGQTEAVREQDIGGEQFTQDIMTFYGMNYHDAEKAKVQKELPASYIQDVLQPFQIRLSQQIKRTLQMYNTSNQQHEFDYVVLTGATAYLDDLAPFLTQALGITTVMANPFQGCLFADMEIRAQIEPQISKYMLACGLTLRSYE